MTSGPRTSSALKDVPIDTTLSLTALPSEGKGQRFESPRARHKINDLGFLTSLGVPEVSRYVGFPRAETAALSNVNGPFRPRTSAGRSACRSSNG
jgi:hypothetical protein